jgi:hypothetical protein
MRVKSLGKIMRKISVDHLASNLSALLKLFFRGKCYGALGIFFFYGAVNLDDRKIGLVGIIFLINFILLKLSSFSVDRISSRTGIKPFIYGLEDLINKFSAYLIESIIIFTVSLMYFNYVIYILKI